MNTRDIVYFTRLSVRRYLYLGERSVNTVLCPTRTDRCLLTRHCDHRQPVTTTTVSSRVSTLQVRLQNMRVGALIRPQIHLSVTCLFTYISEQLSQSSAVSPNIAYLKPDPSVEERVIYFICHDMLYSACSILFIHLYTYLFIP